MEKEEKMFRLGGSDAGKREGKELHWGREERKI